MKREIFLSVTLLAACGLLASSPAGAASEALTATGTGGLQLAWGDGYGESPSKSAGYGGGQQKDDSWEQPKKKTYEEEEEYQPKKKKTYEDDGDDYRPKKKKTYEDADDYKPKKKKTYEKKKDWDSEGGYGGKSTGGQDDDGPSTKPSKETTPPPKETTPPPKDTTPNKDTVPGSSGSCKRLCEAECKVRFNSKVTDQPTAETKTCISACPKKCAGKN